LEFVVVIADKQHWTVMGARTDINTPTAEI